MPDRNPTTDTFPRALAALLLAGVGVLFLAGAADGAWGSGRAPFPFVWRDVAFVQFAGSLPLAWLLAGRIRSSASSLGIVALAGLTLAGSLIPLLGFLDLNGGSIVRAMPALGLTLAFTLLVQNLITPVAQSPSPPEYRARRDIPLFALALCGCLLLPALYVNARTRHDVARLAALWNQSRYGEARTEAHALLALDPEHSWNDRPLRDAATQLDRIVRDLEANTRTPLPGQASPLQRLERARQLAMLGQTQTALEVLESIPASAVTAPVDTLRGTIHEAREDWPSAAASFENALAAWEPSAPSEVKTAGLGSALAGLAYAQRKAGRYVDAEQSYQKLLTVAPTADAHFLLAQFYEDSQQAEKARSHARQAAALAPDRFRQRADQLLRKLSVYQFGCLSIFHAENAQR